MQNRSSLLIAMLLSTTLLMVACGGGGSSSSGGGGETNPFAGQYSGTIAVGDENPANWPPGSFAVFIRISPNGTLQFYMGGELFITGPVTTNGVFNIRGPLTDLVGGVCTGTYLLTGNVTSSQASGSLNVGEGVCNGFGVTPRVNPFTARKVD